METISSTALTVNPSATIRFAKFSISFSSVKDKSALACPAEITPAATFRCTEGGRFNSRIVLVIAGLDLLNLAANSSWV